MASAVRRIVVPDADSFVPGEEIVCIGCGCGDYDTCDGGCSWVAIDRDTGFGICSRCAAMPLDELVRISAQTWERTR